MMSARGEPIRLDIAGDDPTGRHAVAPDRLFADFDSIAPEAACTSMQLHLQVHPDAFAGYWNAAQCLAGVQLAVGANSPFLLRSRLWAETRIPLFEQSCDMRTVELRNQGVRPRVWFGERWISSILDLFSENGRYFPGLLPLAEDTDPLLDLKEGRVPALPELRLHNGTIWRWNRPVYDVAGGVPHVRVENRVLPAGPTAVDMVANALLFYGLLRVLVEADRPLWSSMSFEAAQENFTTAARHGLEGPLYWPGSGWIRPDELVLRKLLPQAADGLARWGVAAAVIDRYLSVIERRCLHRRTGRRGSSTRSRRWRMAARIARRRCTACSAATWSTRRPTSRCTRGRCRTPPDLFAPANRFRPIGPAGWGGAPSVDRRRPEAAWLRDPRFDHRPGRSAAGASRRARRRGAMPAHRRDPFRGTVVSSSVFGRADTASADARGHAAVGAAAVAPAVPTTPQRRIRASPPGRRPGGPEGPPGRGAHRTPPGARRARERGVADARTALGRTLDGVGRSPDARYGAEGSWRPPGGSTAPRHPAPTAARWLAGAPRPAPPALRRRPAQVEQAGAPHPVTMPRRPARTGARQQLGAPRPHMATPRRQHMATLRQRKGARRPQPAPLPRAGRRPMASVRPSRGAPRLPPRRAVGVRAAIAPSGGRALRAR